MNKDKVSGLIFALLGVVIIVMASGIVMPAYLTEPGPRLFPYIAGAGIFVCGLGIFLSNGQEDKVYLDKEGWKKLGLVGALLFVYYLALDYIGFLFASPFVMFAIILILGKGKKVNKIFSAALSIVAVVGLYFLFKNVFTIFLPTGKLF